ncbi:conserved hypothetical protein [Arcobacter nitrofigilis DSM 7299]|uniref:Uncharacterized protein n=1 Tax=Arcobacter nitrofigilis (strain ATCC 33309 / DSM 7299 / CCUG 15893 / LMG 7604 / NCTC 12251 / CI) TaxID=572480 RepID=D5V7A8_ARCNC|nr:hypothetical protein [Arcobacter nitrofigilis]ADG94528.1 conserved hypothetical protein [Arcobacter nitrofigilis DSM 7299]
MNIYIYGKQNFKKDIKDELSRSLIDYKLEGKGLIQEVQSLSTLKELIEDNSDDVFLIDDAKIIKENLINSKIKFLKPKDGIEQEYLKNKGIEDFSVDSIHDISRYILKKMKDLNLDDDIDESDEGREIHDSITNIVNDAYESENLDEDYELSDDLKDLLSQDEEEIINKDEEMIENNEEAIVENEPKESTEQLSSLEDMDEYINLEDITSLDELSEDDILSVFSGKEIKPKVAKKIETKAKEMSIKLDNPNDIKEFLSKLLESKALEITVKIKE